MSNKILVVDDNIRNLMAIEAQLETLDQAEIITAQSADEALALLTETNFCLAIIDIEMTPVSGFELARLIRGVRKFRELPIVFLTAHSHSEQFELDSYEAGGVDILFKPVSRPVIQCKVKAFLQMHQRKQELVAKLEKEEALRQKVEAANKSIALMLANVSHELRTPLGNITGFGELLTMSESLSDEHRYLAEKVLKNSRELKNIIDDVLDLSRMEAGRISIDRTTFSLRELLREVDEQALQATQAKGLRFILAIQDPLPVKVICDPLRMKQVLNNMISNAVKFTESGVVTLSVYYEDEILTCKTQDTGIGINEFQQKALFQPFKQANKAIMGRFGGTGLGLALSKDICEELGGSLVLEKSSPSEGSLFAASFHAPVAEQVVPEKSKQSKSDLLADIRGAALRALYVDDLEENRFVTEALLSHIGIDLHTAESGPEGLRLVAENKYDFILLDIQMPEMDGYEVHAKLREMGYNKTVIALTAHAMPENVEKCKALGFDGFLSKPVSIDKIAAELKALLP